MSADHQSRSSLPKGRVRAGSLVLYAAIAYDVAVHGSTPLPPPARPDPDGPSRQAAGGLSRALADGERLVLGRHAVRWLDTPHVPHAWECGFLSDETTRTFLCGDLFTQPGASHPPVTSGDILGPSEAMRGSLDYWAHAASPRPTLERLTSLQPTTLACMRGPAWTGDGAGLIREL